MRKIDLLVLVGLLVVAFGCKQGEEKSISGIVTDPAGTALTYAPEVTFTTPEDGRTWKLSNLYGPDVTILAFATLEGETCARASAPILTAAKKMKGEGIPLVEITWPTGGCDVAACTVAFHERAYLFTCLTDPEGKARTAFGLGEQDKVFLIGPNGKIEKTVTPDQVNVLVAEAMKLQHDKQFTYTEFVY